MITNVKTGGIKDRLPPTFHSGSEPLSFLKAIFVLLLLTTIWIFILPGIVAWSNRVFYDDQVAKRMKEPALSAYKEYQKQRGEINEIEARLVEKLEAGAQGNAAGEEMRSLADSLKEVSGFRESLHPPVHPLGFSSDDSLIVFFVHFVFLGILYLLSARHGNRPDIATTLSIGLAIYLLFGWPNLLRNFVFTTYSPSGSATGRTVFASLHWDIDRSGFLLQEARVLSMFLFDAVLWQLWMEHLRDVTEKTRDWSFSAKLDDFGARASLLNTEFNRWQSHSLLLIGAFLPWTWFFWRKFSVQGDARYISTTVVMHIIWAISWLLLSLPTLETWRRWSDYRLKALNSIVRKETDDAEAERTLKLFIEASPVNSLKIFGTGAAGLASMLLPLAHVFFKG
jgi:hypothetical protein